MRVVIPLQIGAAQVVSSSIPEPDASVGEVEYAAGTTYALGARVIRASTHRVYESLAAGNIGNTPETSPDHWLDVAATNRYAAFDHRRTVPSTDTDTLVYEITPGTRVDTIALLGVTAASVELQVSTPGEGVVLTRTQTLSTRFTTGLYSYFFGAFRQRRNPVFLLLPPISGATYTLTLAGTGAVQVTHVVMGMGVQIGQVQFDALDDALNFSTIKRDEAGTAELKRGRIVPTLMPPILAAKQILPVVRQVREDTRGIAALWIGIDRVDDAHFDSYLIFGVWKRFAIRIKNSLHSDVNIELENL